MQTIPTDILKHFSAVLEKRAVPATSHADYRKWLRYSQVLLLALKETPSDAKVVSHKLMLRAGMTRKVAAGINPIPLKVQDTLMSWRVYAAT